ncbi:hypothetical protein CSUNSWCD_442 [Campylobacter showae CSUNSWCD]|uniref:Uncharacterized protein n=1 Tax=Campylobacter showae CSUNSWCD TaxID=1244083 RepID=M5IIR3_9BACT|nr:hypothetical protein CSUNSWCD_442 [Campylobacter showae CSUNSWCD]
MPSIFAPYGLNFRLNLIQANLTSNLTVLNFTHRKPHRENAKFGFIKFNIL